MADIKISQMTPWVGAVTGNIEIPAVFANENYRIAFSQFTPSTFGFGDMALQNANAVQITGGNVAVTALSGAITIANGGTGLGTTPTNGQLLIGNGTGYSLATLTAGTGIVITNSAGGITIDVSGGTPGTVSSVNVDGGTTGLTFSGGPITTTGTITAGGILAVANGGTGASTAGGARAALGAAAAGANSDITSLTGLTTPLSANQGGTGAAGSLSGYIYGNGNSPFTSVLTIPISDLTGTLPINKGGTNATTAAAARVNLLPSYTGNGGKALFLNAGATDVEWQSVSGAGTVTSVDVSGGTTGLTTSGGPIIAAGTITLAGTLLPTAGGTGITSFTVGDLLFANTTTQLDRLAIGGANYILTSNGTAPAYVAPGSISVGSATTATNLAGGAAGSIPYQSASGTTAMLAAGTGVLMGGTTPAYTMTPSLTQVTVAGDPSTALQVATKQYVDGLVSSGITYHTAVKYEVPNSTGNLNAIYNQPGGPGDGVGATLTNNGTLAAFAPDGPTAQVGDRILVYNQTNAFENGVYEVTTVGDGSTAWVLTRAADADTYGLKDTNALGNGDAFFISAGDTGKGETYVCNTSGTITFGSTAINFTQVSSAQVYSAGTGLTLTNTTFSLTSPVATSLGGTGLTSFTANGAVYATSTSALTTGTLPVNAGGTGQTSFADGELLIGNTTGNTLTKATLTAGTGISVTNGNGSITIANTAPDQTVALTGGTGISITGTYPNFTITNTGGAGTVTSVSGTGTVNGLTLTGTVTSSGSLTLGGTLTGVDLTTAVTGTLPIANGGTNATATPTAGAVAYGTGSAYAFTSVGTAGQVLISNAGSAPTFGNINGGTF